MLPMAIMYKSIWMWLADLITSGVEITIPIL